MTDLQSQSPAFRQALRESERLRIYLLLASIVFILVLRGTRTLVAPTAENVTVFQAFLAVAFVLCLVELATLWVLIRELKGKPIVPLAFWLVNILLEFSLPALSIGMVASAAMAQGYRPLLNPIFTLYFLLLIFSILRLNPPLSVACGMFGSFTYLIAAWHTGWRPLHSKVNSMPQVAGWDIAAWNQHC